MSRPRKKGSTKVPPPRHGLQSLVRSRRFWASSLGAAVVLAGFLGLAKWRSGPGAPSLPVVATNRLDQASCQLVHQAMSQAQSSPRSGPAWGRLAAVLKSFEFREEAMRCFEVAARLDPSEPRWPYHRATLLAGRSPSNAIIELRRAVALCGDEPEIPRLRLARLLMETGGEDEARQQLEQLLRSKPDHAPSLLALARLAQAQGSLTQAVSQAQRCTADPQTAQAAWTLLSVLHFRLGDTNASQQAGRKAASVAPDLPPPDPFEAEVVALRSDARMLSDQAQQFLVARRLPEAAPLVDRLVQEHPGFSETWLLLGRLQYLQKNTAGAEQALRRHLDLDPQSVNGIFQLGMCLLDQQRYPEAVDAFRKATQLKADFGPAFFNLGFALAKSGRKQEAVEPFRNAIRHDPNYMDSYILLADLYLQMGARQEAAESARQAEALNPGDRRLPVLRQKLRMQP